MPDDRGGGAPEPSEPDGAPDGDACLAAHRPVGSHAYRRCDLHHAGCGYGSCGTDASGPAPSFATDPCRDRGLWRGLHRGALTPGWLTSSRRASCRHPTERIPAAVNIRHDNPSPSATSARNGIGTRPDRRRYTAIPAWCSGMPAATDSATDCGSPKSVRTDRDLQASRRPGSQRRCRTGAVADQSTQVALPETSAGVSMLIACPGLRRGGAGYGCGWIVGDRGRLGHGARSVGCLPCR